MEFKLSVALAAVAVGYAGIAVGQDAPIPARQEIMKMNGAVMKKVGAMVKGETPFNATEAADGMKIIADNMTEFPSLFPPGSDQGDTKAGGAIWSDTAGFQAAATKLVTDAKAAQEAAAGGLETFSPAFEQVGSNCGGCHKIYRE
jgi:cytochrome c556